MKLSRTGASADHGTYSFDSKALRVTARTVGDALQLNLLFSGTLSKGSKHNYNLSLNEEEVAKIFSVLSSSLDGKDSASVSQALSESTKDLVRLTAASANILV